MKRYPAFDPPEYLDWKADSALVDEFSDRIKRAPAREAIVASLSQEELLRLYEGMVRNRLHDITLKRWVRGGVISKAWLGTGEEAVTIGAVHALDRERDIVSPMIRNAGACHEMGMSLESLFHGYLGTVESPSRGTDLHVGDLEQRVLPPISPVGDTIPVVAGIALSFQQRGESRVALAWIGDGSTKTAAFHEGMNLAAVRRSPAIFVIQNNQVALGTRLEQHGAGALREWPRMYGVAGLEADGNNVLDVYAATRIAADRCRAGEGPVMLIVETFRMGGHATHDEREARETLPAELFAQWGRRDPIGLYEAWLEQRGIERERLEAIEAEVSEEVESAAER
ncbi:MAG TPA: thiamine pyrophosphate-dependent dehydrogenase E1 component subunit alpha, partial [Longimicrobiales bacterium]|nr:thiamine pyrophosphate-dependent dehydrogenase E1 component subunit alpha [Longimicrobiales bacterium]